jgi:hypothetical protein
MFDPINLTPKEPLPNDEISVTPQVSVGFIKPNDPVDRVDFGQTMVNLGHHLENIIDKL